MVLILPVGNFLDFFKDGHLTNSNERNMLASSFYSFTTHVENEWTTHVVIVPVIGVGKLHGVSRTTILFLQI